jgi:hypothetical protein
VNSGEAEQFRKGSQVSLAKMRVSSGSIKAHLALGDLPAEGIGGGSVGLQMRDLLEEYAPSWYPDLLREGVDAIVRDIEVVGQPSMGPGS